MMYRNPAPWLIGVVAMLAGAFPAAVSGSQETADSSPTPASLRKAADLEVHMDQLASKIDKMREQLQESQNEMVQFRAELNTMRAQLTAKTESEQAAQDAASLREGVAQLRDQTEVLEAEVKQHDQTKLESATKYPVRISGMLLFTSILQSGTADNIDLPTVALANPTSGPTGSLGATARQTFLGISASGPRIWGAKASSDLNIDFFGGQPYGDYQTAAGTVRFRTGHATLEWPNRALVAAFDKPLISPLQPTSWVSVGEPALAWSGNLWTWSPQVQFKETRILHRRPIAMEFALIDPAAPGITAAGGNRLPDPSERSRQPGFEARFSADLSLGGHPVKVGAGSYYSRQAYQYGRHVDAWAGTADWDMPIARSIEFSGEFYRGRAIGGLGGGAFKDYVTDVLYTSLRGLNAEGGWGQLKFRLMSSLEGNIAAGQDNAFANDLRNSNVSQQQDAYSNLARNQSAFGNLVFRPRPYFLISAEFRRLASWTVTGESYQDRIVGFAGGYSF